MNLNHLYRAAEAHLLTAITAMALESTGIHDPVFTQARNKAIRKIVLMDTESKRLFACLEDEGIWYMPLKGCVLKDLYPAIGMRQMADYDILIDASRAKDVKDIMEELGFTTKYFGMSNQDVYRKMPVCNFEIHTALVPPGSNEKQNAYYLDVEDRLIRETGYARHFTPEDFYLFMIVHEYKHYSGCGTGLRSLLDTYVYLNASALDMDYVVHEAGKLGIAAFEAANRSLALHLFGGEALTSDDRKMLDYMLSSGTYGTVKNNIRNTMRERNWTKVQYALHRFLVPMRKDNPDYDSFAGAYPFFYRHRILLPVLMIFRATRSMIAGRFIAEARAIKNA